MSRKRVLVDANLFMHFRFWEMNWKEIAGCDEVVLDVSSITIAELDKHKDLDAETFQGQMGRNRSEETLVKRQLADVQLEVPDVESILPFAERVLRDPGGLWEDAELPQRYLFPEGLRYDGESFGIAVRSPVFETLGSLGARGEEVVTPRGFEPLSPG